MIVQEYNGEVKAYDIRMAESKDLDYITNSWLLAHRMSPEWAMPNTVDREYFHYTHKKLDEIIPRCSAKGGIYMCHQPDHPDQYRGYLVAEAFEDFPPIVHWLQVKKKDKRQGVAKALMTQFFMDFELSNTDTLVYTFSACDMKKRWLQEAVKREGIKLLYIPDLKHTLNEPNWEA